MSDPKVYKNFINGEWVDSASGQTYENRNPADNDEVVGVFQKSNEADVSNALDAAAEAYKKWRLVPAPKRGEMLYNVARRLLDKKEEYSQEMTREMGKVIKETRGDTQEAIDMTFYMAGEGRRLYGMTTPSEMENKFNMTVRQPLGVCSFITPWNYPLVNAVLKVAPGLAAGNAIVLKPSIEAPLATVAFARLCGAAGIPPGIVNVVLGSGSRAGNALVAHPMVKKVSFTGSTEIGRVISKACAPEFKHCSLEMGGKNVEIVMDDADLELAVDGALWGAFGTTGQRCTATSRIVCHKDVVGKFTDMMVERANKLKIGNGLDESVDMGPSINQSQLDTVMEYVEIGKNEDGAKLVCGGERLTGGDYDKGFYHQPTIFTEVTQKMRIWREEIFGPVLGIATCSSLEEAIEMANDTDYGLSASIFTNDVRNAYVAMRDVYTGIFYVNAPTIGAETHMPFGGTKHTGNGHREASEAALDVFSEWKSCYVDYSGTLQRAQIDNQ